METQGKFFSIVGGGAGILLVLSFGVHFLATRGGRTLPAQGKLVRRTDGSPVAGATIYASESPVMVLSRSAQGESVILGGEPGSEKAGIEIL